MADTPAFLCLRCKREFTHWVGISRHLNQAHDIHGNRAVKKNSRRYEGT